MLKRLRWLIVVTLLAAVLPLLAWAAGVGQRGLMPSTSRSGVTASLTASPTSITSGASSTLTWTSTGAPSCTGSNFSTGGAKSGTASVSPTVNTTYGVTCGTATANASVTVTGGTTTACEIGPAYPGAVPPPAQAAGYTNCILNADFTSTAGADIHGINFGDPNTFLYNCNSSNKMVQYNNTAFWIEQEKQEPGVYDHPGCGRVSYVNDTSGGGPSQVLTFSSLNNSTDYPPYYLTTLRWPMSVQGYGPCVGSACGAGPQGHGLWRAWYVEAEFRLSASSSVGQVVPSSSDCPNHHSNCVLIPLDWWENGCNGCGVPFPPGTTASCEIDFFETGGAPPQDLVPGIHCAPWTKPPDMHVDLSAYHTFGTLLTGDGGANFGFCEYLDGGIASNTNTGGCGSGTYAAGGQFPSGGTMAGGSWGGGFDLPLMACVFPSTTSTAATECSANPVQAFVQRITVWVCPNSGSNTYWTRQCSGTIITH